MYLQMHLAPRDVGNLLTSLVTVQVDGYLEGHVNSSERATAGCVCSCHMGQVPASASPLRQYRYRLEAVGKDCTLHSVRGLT